MILARARVFALASAVTAVLLAGCSVTGSRIPGSASAQPSGAQSNQQLGFLSQQARTKASSWRANPGPGWISPGALTGRLVYVSDENGQAVYIFPQIGQNQAPIGKITSGVAAPNGLFVDAAENLYVCNFGGGTVSVYHKATLTPYRTLTGAGSAIDVVVGLDGTVYVSDWDSGSAGHVLEYPKHHNKPSVSIPINGASEGLALDVNNNLFVAYNDATANDGEVLEFAPGSTNGTNLGIHVGYVGGATIDAAGNLLVDDQNIPGVDVFPPGATQPSNQIKGFALAFDIALTHTGTRLWVTDPFVAVNEVTYPGGKHVNSITNTISTAFGVATSPHGSY